MTEAVERHVVAPGTRPRLGRIDPGHKGEHGGEEDAEAKAAACLERLSRLQCLLYADGARSLLVVLQGLDAAGKDGTIRHVFAGMNPQGVRVVAFRQPTPLKAAHDFLWRTHLAAPARGEVAVFNCSHYEDVLVVRVHGLVPEPVWRARFDQINAWEATLAAAGTKVVKLFLHISPEDQLERFRKQLEDPERQWKISESDYTERAFRDRSIKAYEEAIERASTAAAPWYVIPSDHKRYRKLAVAEIIAATLGAMDLSTPPVRVDLDDVRRRFHAADNGHDRPT